MTLFGIPVEVMSALTPLMIGLVGIGQLCVVAWGIHVMQRAAQERSKQMEPMQQALLEVARGIRELLDRDDRR